MHGHTVRFRLNAPGRHMAMNALAALAAAAHISGAAPGMYQRVARALEAFVPIAGRGARRRIAVPGGSALLLDESYNGNPASMRAALAVLRLQPAQRRIAVLGDMLELGECRSRRTPWARRRAWPRRRIVLFACGPLMQRAVRRGA